MHELWLDGNKVDVSGPETWGDLLERLESEHLGEDRIIRTIAFDGQEQDDFRSEAVVTRTVDRLARVDVESVGLRDFSRELLVDAPRHIDQVAQVLVNTVRFYRQNLPTDGAAQLHAALSGFDMLLQLVGTSVGIWTTELESIEGSPAISEAALVALKEAFAQLVAAQERNDVDEIARLVETELIPRMEPWSALFAELNLRLAREG